jgi:FimV N-terminal domain
MGLRTRAYFIGVFLAVVSPMAAALGLGEIKLNSALNQPLNAEIQLLHVRDLTESEIRIAIASPEEFARAGVDRNFFITDLKFTLDLNASSGPVVRVTSNGPVREPFLNFIVSARWPSGKLLREYTLLVDLPVFSGNQAAPVQAANQRPSQTTPSDTTQAQTPRTTPRTTPSPQRAEERPPTTSRSSFSGDSYGPVGANETLWSIASRVKPDSSVSVQQTMLAIQRMNPEAFINGNINLLRRGQVLRIPDKDEIQQLSNREAIQQVAAQNRSWNDKTPEQAQLEGSKNFTQTRTEPSSVEGRVKLSSPSSDTAGQGAGAEGQGDGARVTEELSQAQEELDAADRENADLKSRIQAMEEQIQTMERLVEVSSAEMRALELAAQQANQEETTEAPTADTSVEEVQSTESVDTAVQDAPSEQVAQPQPEAKPVPPAKSVQAQKSWMDLALDNILYIGIGLGVLILALAVYLFKRNRREEYDEYDDYENERDVELGAFGDIDAHDDKTVPLSDFDDVESEQEERALAEAETEDVVGECDIHIAYGQYDQAEEKLLRALEKDPSNSAVRLKLLEVFAIQGDADSFDQHYARLRAQGDTNAIDRATVIRDTIEGIGPFDSSLYETSELASSDEGAYESYEEDSFATSDALADDTLNFDFNDVDELVDSSASTSSDQGELEADSLDFDLTLDEDDVTQISPSRFASTPDELATTDLDLGDLDEPVASLDEQNTEAGFGGSPTSYGEIDFELPDEDLAVAAEAKSDDSFAEDFDLEFEKDRFTGEFTDDLVAERVAPKEDDDSFDFADLDLTEPEQDLDLASSSSSEALDFDLDQDIADAQTGITDEPPVLSSSAENAGTDLGDFEFDDLEQLETEEDSQPELTSTAGSEGTNDFDMDFDLDKEVNLDELDHELDALASDFGGASPEMEEPVLDFDDDISTGSVAAFGEGDASPEQDLDDLFAEDDKTVAVNDVAEKDSAATYETANSGLDFEIPDFDPENDDDSNLDFLSDNDETATKLDLARAYIDMGDADGAKDILDEILEEGNDQQKREAETLLARIG